jgi:hypothetical protein
VGYNEENPGPRQTIGPIRDRALHQKNAECGARSPPCTMIGTGPERAAGWDPDERGLTRTRIREKAYREIEYFPSPEV